MPGASMTTTARPPAGVRRARRLAGPLATAAAVGLGTLALRVRDPHQHGSWGLCPFKAITGWNCPFCGGLRAVNDLGHGRIVEAAHSNLLFVGSIPLLVAVWVLWARRDWTGAPSRVPAGLARVAAIAVGVLLVAFAAYRNTPWGSAWRVS
jgi:hypothetical protein